MKKASIIISRTETACGVFESQQCHCFDNPAGAKASVLRYLEDESHQLGIPSEKGSGDIMSLFGHDKEGNFSYTIGDHEFHFAFLRTDADYSVDDEELTRVLEAFCNTGRTGTDYLNAARTVSTKMHRYCQNELWKFVRKIIEAFADGPHDERNHTAWDQAGEIQEFILNNNKF